MRSWASSPAPETIRLPWCSALRSLTPSVRSPSRSVAFRVNGPVSVRDATYLGMVFIRCA
jgi:hypothetical protein